MADDLVVVHAFNSRPEADLAKSALDAAGIDAMVRADSGGGMRPALAWAGGGMRSSSAQTTSKLRARFSTCRRGRLRR